MATRKAPRLHYDRADCGICGRRTAVLRSRNLAPHVNRAINEWCEGGGTTDWAYTPVDEPASDDQQTNQAVDPTDNTMATATGGWGFAMTPEEAEAYGIARAKRARYDLLDHPLTGWWMTLAEEDLVALLPKVQEYSAYDLIMVGRATADMAGFAGDPESELRWPAPVDDAVAAEIACWFYILGKIGRAIGAIKEGRLPSIDTITDVRIYATMAHRIRETGAWPGVQQP